jgi:hypothetical protein
MNEKPTDIPRLAVAYRRLVLWFGAQLLVPLGSIVFQFAVQGRTAGSPAKPLMEPVTWATIFSQSSLPATAAAIALVIGSLVISVALAFYAYHTADALGSTVPILWVVAMVVPLANLLALLALSSKAATICQASGIPVGFFGPKLSS